MGEGEREKERRKEIEGEKERIRGWRAKKGGGPTVVVAETQKKKLRENPLKRPLRC